MGYVEDVPFCEKWHTILNNVVDEEAIITLSIYGDSIVRKTNRRLPPMFFGVHFVDSANFLYTPDHSQHDVFVVV